MYDLAPVLGVELAGGPAQQLGQLPRVVADEAAGDRANDPIRITGAQVRAKVIGEGANLGMTQRGRIEAARNGSPK